MSPLVMDFLGGSDSKESACDVGDLGSIPGLGRSPGGEHGNPLQYPCQENPMDRGAWRATVLGVAKSWTQLSTSTFGYSVYHLNTARKLLSLVSSILI